MPFTARRLRNALWRRARYVRWRLARRSRRPAVEAALDWLLKMDTGHGVPADSGQRVACPGATGACIETLLEYGCREEAMRWSAWLIEIQRPDGRTIPAPDGSAGELARTAETCLESNHAEAARTAMETAGAAQRRDGSVRERLASGPVLSASLAHLAVVWYRLGDRRRADRVMQYLGRRQEPNGGFRGAWGRSIPAGLNHEDTWAVKYYLDAARLQAHTAFEARWQEFPQTIDPADGRVQAVRRWMAALGVDARVADVGCGKGRFLRHLIAWFPKARLTGIDFCRAMLVQLPLGVKACQGNLLRIPAVDGQFDGAFACESLEHALVPKMAVAELCRIVRPGGRVLVIDKDLAKQPLSEHDPWVRWFTPEQLSAWLRDWCTDVTVERVSHIEGRGGDDLFLAAGGTRRVNE